MGIFLLSAVRQTLVVFFFTFSSMRRNTGAGHVSDCGCHHFQPRLDPHILLLKHPCHEVLSTAKRAATHQTVWLKHYLNTWSDKRKALITQHASLYGFLNELFFEVCHFNTNIFDAAIKITVSYKTCRLTSCVERCICSLDNFLSERQPNSGSVLRKLHWSPITSLEFCRRDSWLLSEDKTSTLITTDWWVGSGVTVDCA